MRSSKTALRALSCPAVVVLGVAAACAGPAVPAQQSQSSVATKQISVEDQLNAVLKRLLREAPTRFAVLRGDPVRIQVAKSVITGSRSIVLTENPGPITGDATIFDFSASQDFGESSIHHLRYSSPSAKETATFLRLKREIEDVVPKDWVRGGRGASEERPRWALECAPNVRTGIEVTLDSQPYDQMGLVNHPTGPAIDVMVTAMACPDSKNISPTGGVTGTLPPPSAHEARSSSTLGAPAPVTRAQVGSFCDALKTIVDGHEHLFENLRDMKATVNKSVVPGETEYFSLVNLPDLPCRIYVDEDLDIATVQCSRRVAGTTLAANAYSDTVANVRSCGFTNRWNVSEQGQNLKKTFTATDDLTQIQVRSSEHMTMIGIYHIMLTVENR